MWLEIEILSFHPTSQGETYTEALCTSELHIQFTVVPFEKPMRERERERESERERGGTGCVWQMLIYLYLNIFILKSASGEGSCALKSDDSGINLIL